MKNDLRNIAIIFVVLVIVWYVFKIALYIMIGLFVLSAIGYVINKLF